MKLGFILTNNVEFIQIDNQEETNKVVMKNLKPQPADILPRCAIFKRLRYEKQIKAFHLFRLLSLEMLHRRVEIEKQDFRKKAMDDYFDTDSPTNHLQPNTICDLFCHSNQLEYI